MSVVGKGRWSPTSRPAVATDGGEAWARGRPDRLRHVDKQAHRDRLTAIDASFLHQEKQSSHMHVGALVTFEGPPPAHEDFVQHAARPVLRAIEDFNEAEIDELLAFAEWIRWRRSRSIPTGEASPQDGTVRR